MPRNLKGQELLAGVSLKTFLCLRVQTCFFGSCSPGALLRMWPLNALLSNTRVSWWSLSRAFRLLVTVGSKVPVYFVSLGLQIQVVLLCFWFFFFFPLFLGHYFQAFPGTTWCLPLSFLSPIAGRTVCFSFIAFAYLPCSLESSPAGISEQLLLLLPVAPPVCPLLGLTHSSKFNIV